MKKDKLLLFAALAAIGYGLWKLLGQSTKPKATANSTLKTTGSGITPGFFPGFTAPGGSTGKAPTGGPSEGGKQGGANIDLGAAIEAGTEAARLLGKGVQYFWKSVFGSSPSTPQLKTTGLASGANGELYQDIGGIYVPTELPASVSYDYQAGDYGPVGYGNDPSGAPDLSIFDQPQTANA